MINVQYNQYNQIYSNLLTIFNMFINIQFTLSAVQKLWQEQLRLLTSERLDLFIKPCAINAVSKMRIHPMVDDIG